MSRRLISLCLLSALLLTATPAAAADGGFLRTERLRYDRANVFLRVVADIPAAPATVVDWRAPEWITFAGVTATVGTLMAPLNPPLDIRFDDWVTREVDPWLPDLWSMNFQIPLWTTLATSAFGLWGASAYVGDTALAETMSLMGEAVAVTQFYHLTLKLALGREDGGAIRGFPASLGQFPRGTPGGHFGTLYSMYGVVEAYWKPHWAVRVGMHSLLAFGAITHALNHRHYISDQVFGAAIGYSVAYWVVHNRSTRYRYDDAGHAVRIAVVPVPRGIGLAGTF